MLLIPCPNCGARDQSEFSYGGLRAPLPPLDASIGDWHTAVHLRSGEMPVREELWYHACGCERWIVVSRNLTTHEFAPKDAS